MKNIIRLCSLLLILILLLSACQSEETMASKDAQDFLTLVDQRIDDKVPTQTPKWLSATVISTSGGLAEVHLGTDPIGTNVWVQNSREISLEAGDEVSLLVFGSLSNCIIDFRKDIAFDDIYIDYNVGVDDYKHGTATAPFKTLQYAVDRLSKNLNGREIDIHLVNVLSSWEINVANFYGGGILKIDGGTLKSIKRLFVERCTSVIQINYVGCNSSSTGSYYNGFDIDTCANVSLSNIAVTGISGGAIGVSGINSNITVQNSAFTSNIIAIVSGQGANIISSNNSGSNTSYGLEANDGGMIIKKTTQPTGVTANEHTTYGGTIK